VECVTSSWCKHWEKGMGEKRCPDVVYTWAVIIYNIYTNSFTPDHDLKHNRHPSTCVYLLRLRHRCPVCGPDIIINYDGGTGVVLEKCGAGNARGRLFAYSRTEESAVQCSFLFPGRLCTDRSCWGFLERDAV
jgi:hypothetical protein